MKGVPVFVLIIFVVLWVASTVGLVLLFVKQEELTQQTEQATAKYQEEVGSKAKDRIEQYKALGKEQRKTAVEALLDERDALAEMLTGNPNATSAEAKEKMTNTLNALPAKADMIKQLAQSDLIGGLQVAAHAVVKSGDQVEAVQNQLAQFEQRNATITKQFRELETTFNARAEKFTSQLKNLENQFSTVKQQQEQMVNNIKTQVSKQLLGDLNKVKAQFTESVSELRKIMRQNLRLIVATSKELGPAELRVAAGVTIEQLMYDPDGQIMSNTGQRVYVNLGAEHHVKSGMRFMVYSVLEKDLAHPQLKGIIEITAPADVTSEAKIIASIEGNPILPNDYICNLIYTRELELTFFVLGDFDLDGDGLIESTARDKVQHIIAMAGGTVSEEVSPKVTFAIIGQSPAKPEPISSAAGAEVRTEYAGRLKRYRSFVEQKQQLDYLSVPAISQDVFRRLTGYDSNL